MNANFTLTNRGRANLNVGVVILAPGVPKTVPLTLTHDYLAQLNKQQIHVTFKTPEGSVLVNGDILTYTGAVKAAPHFRHLTDREMLDRMRNVGPVIKDVQPPRKAAEVLAELETKDFETGTLLTTEETEVVPAKVTTVEELTPQQMSDLIDKFSTEETEAETAIFTDAVFEDTAPVETELSNAVRDAAVVIFEDAQPEKIEIPSREELEEMHGMKVKALCRKLGLEDKGAKADLIDSILNYNQG